jgi:hypothetical protein
MLSFLYAQYISFLLQIRLSLQGLSLGVLALLSEHDRDSVGRQIRFTQIYLGTYLDFSVGTVVGFRGPLQKSHDLEDDFPLRTH